MSLTNLKNYLNGCIADGVPNDISNTSLLELVDAFEAVQKDAARYQWIAKQKDIWAVLGDRYNMPEIDEGATTFDESIDIAMASKS